MMCTGEAKMVYVTEDPTKPPPDTLLAPPPTKKHRWESLSVILTGVMVRTVVSAHAGMSLNVRSYEHM
jgi:hypothetical protein